MHDSNLTCELTEQQITAFHENGYLPIVDLLNAEQATRYRELYDRFLDGTIRTGHLRSDLSGQGGDAKKKTEKITQIMWPSHLIPMLIDGPLHQHCLAIAKQLFGADMAIDFDMLIDKPPHTNTATPWHQDAAYWPDLPDKRAISFWVALDEATVDNGCMWYVPGSHHQPIRDHQQVGNGGALQCDGNENEAHSVPLKSGGCVAHHGYTLHYSRGNTTAKHRRAFIVNCRPLAMIQLERKQGYDHGLTKNVRKVRGGA